jgi:hypothetical protein
MLMLTLFATSFEGRRGRSKLKLQGREPWISLDIPWSSDPGKSSKRDEQKGMRRSRQVRDVSAQRGLCVLSQGKKREIAVEYGLGCTYASVLGSALGLGIQAHPPAIPVLREFAPAARRFLRVGFTIVKARNSSPSAADADSVRRSCL